MTTPTPGALAGEAVAGTALASGAKKALGAIPGAQELGDITDGVRAVRAWISNRHNWVRVAWFLSGAGMFVVGIVLIGERPAAKAAATAAKAAKYIPK